MEAINLKITFYVSVIYHYFVLYSLEHENGNTKFIELLNGLVRLKEMHIIITIVYARLLGLYDHTNWASLPSTFV